MDDLKPLRDLLAGNGETVEVPAQTLEALLKAIEAADQCCTEDAYLLRRGDLVAAVSDK